MACKCSETNPMNDYQNQGGAMMRFAPQQQEHNARWTAFLRDLLGPMPRLVADEIGKAFRVGTSALSSAIGIGADGGRCGRSSPMLQAAADAPCSPVQCEYPLVAIFPNIAAGASATRTITPTNTAQGVRITAFGPAQTFTLDSVSIDNSTYVGGSGGVPYVDLYFAGNNYRGVVLPEITANTPVSITVTNTSAAAATCQIVLQGPKARTF